MTPCLCGGCESCQRAQGYWTPSDRPETCDDCGAGGVLTERYPGEWFCAACDARREDEDEYQAALEQACAWGR